MDYNKIKVYTCPICKKEYPSISNSAPHKDNEPCVICILNKEK